MWENIGVRRWARKGEWEGEFGVAPDGGTRQGGDCPRGLEGR